MAVRDSVFGSGSEREHYHHLFTEWGENWRVYHNLPYLQIFDLDQLRAELTGREQARLKKTSVDYTLCDEDDAPLLSVEFDGLGQGFNLGDEYRTRGTAPSPWRKEIMNLKLRIAHSSDYPFFVVGSSMFEQVTSELRLTLVDGIIGTVLANRKKRKLIPEYLAQRIGDSTERDEEERRKIQDEIMGLEVQAEMDYDPLSQARWERAAEVTNLRWRIEPVFDPPLPEATSLKNVKKRIDGMVEARLVGCRVTLLDTGHGEVSATAWIPNFDTPYFDALAANLPEDVAFLLACEKLDQLQKGH